jgi:hypothetical protein
MFDFDPRDYSRDDDRFTPDRERGSRDNSDPLDRDDDWRQRTQGSGYFTEYEEQNVLVRPGEKFAHVTVVFAKQPDEQTIYRTLMTELTNAVRKQARKWPTTAFAETGSAANPASRTQIKGPAGRFISAEYDSKTGIVTNERGERIGSIR